MPVETPAPPLPGSYWVLPGTLLAGEHPRCAVAPAETRERLRRLLAAGIDCFIDLTMPDELEPYERELPAGVQYLRRPIRDHSLPAQREHMVEILGHIERALAAGRRVYLHCHAGIGRTGMVVGCFLVGRGEAGEDALDELNRLWQQCERSGAWPYIPETEDQIAYVRSWTRAASSDPAVQLASIPLATRTRSGATRARAVVPRAAANASRGAADRGLRERFHGALLGLAVGDALAAATQDRKPGTFEPIEDLVGGGVFDLPPGAWSDDTAMALCLAESLLESEGFDAHDQVDRYARWQQQGYLSATGQCIGITANTARALSTAQWRRQIFAGSHDPKQLDPEVLSRVAPAVMFAYGSPEEALRLACDASRTTCQAPMALDACRILAAMIHGALAGDPKERVLAPPVELLDIGGMGPRVAALLRKSGSSSARRPRAPATVVGALAAALRAFRTTGDFREGALQVANLGSRSDVASAAYGQLAGAYYGVQAIPAAWRSALVSRDLITGFADRLLSHAQRRIG